MAKNNLNYGKLNADGAIEYAPSAMHTDLGWSFNPSEADYLSAGWLRIAHNAPETREGYTSRQTGYDARDGRIWAVYDYSAAEPSPILISKSKVEAVVDQMGKTQAFMSWLNSRARYIGAWLRGGDEIAYDPEDNESDLASLMASLGLGADEIGGLIQQVVA